MITRDHVYINGKIKECNIYIYIYIEIGKENKYQIFYFSISCQKNGKFLVPPNISKMIC